MNIDQVYARQAPCFYTDSNCKQKMIESLRSQIDVYKEEAENIQDEVQYEIDSISFQLTDKGLTWAVRSTSHGGSPYNYPDIKTYIGDKLDYVKGRYYSTGVAFAKARYGHIMWESGNKDFRVLNTVIEHYFETAQILLAKPGKEHIGLVLLRNAFRYSTVSRHGGLVESIRAYILNGAVDINSVEALWLNFALINLMLQYKKFFKAELFDGLVDDIMNLRRNLDDSHNTISLLEMCIEIDKRTNSDSSKLYGLLGVEYEKLSHNDFDPNGMMSPRLAHKAVQYFKKAGNIQKEKELRQRYELLKSRMKLGEIEFEFDLTELYEEIEKVSDSLIDQEPNIIYMALMYSDFILPTYSSISDMARSQRVENSFLSVFSGSVIDNNGHVAEHFTTEDEHLQAGIFQNCNYSMKFCYSHLHSQIFLKGVLTGKITPINIYEFFTEGTWLGQDITRTIKQGEEETYNWIYMVMPAITEYISQLRTYLYSGSIMPYSILSLDSLVLKFEGILRDVVALRGGETSYLKDDERGRPIAMEKDVNALLNDPYIKNFYNKSDYMILRYALIEKVGLNLRNRIAHSLMRHPLDYSIQYMNLLIVIIFRLAKREYQPK